jgi:2-phosphoglycerate kinase
VACGVLLTVSKEEVHKSLLLKRGFITGQTSNEKKKLKSFDRVRQIQEEMIKLAKDSEWILIEQKVEMDPLDLIALKLEEQPEECSPEIEK